MKLSFDHADQATNWAIQWLNDRGYEVRERQPELGEWLTPKALRAQTPHLGPGALSNRLKDSRCPQFRARRGPSGRILQIQATPSLLAFLNLGGQPGIRLPIPSV